MNFESIDFTKPSYFENPAATLGVLRDAAPIHFDKNLGKWIVTRYKDIQELAGNPHLTSNYHSDKFARMPFPLRWWFNPLVSTLSHALLYAEPPQHTKLRKLGNKAFSPTVMKALTPEIEKASSDLLSKMNPNQSVEMISAYAFPLPIIVICEILGVTYEDRQLFRDCSDKISDLIVKGKPGLGHLLKANSSIHKLREYFLKDLDSALEGEGFTSTLAASLKQGELTIDEYLAFCILLLIAGHETTKNMIGNCIWALTKHPKQLQLLRDQPELLDSAIEECLRFETAVPIIKRRVIGDFDFRSTAFRAGDEVLLALASGNRDPEKFTDPDILDIRRGNSHEHLTFGFGRHFCLGSILTKIELKVALTHLLKKYETLQIEKTPVWRDALSHHGPSELWIRNDQS